MRTLTLIALAVFAAALAGCGRASQESVQQQIADEAEELASVLNSDMPHEQKLAKTKEIAARLNALVEKAQELGEPTGVDRQKVARTRERELASAKQLVEAAEKLADQE